MAATLSMMQIPHSLDIPIKSEYSSKEDDDDLWLKLETDEIPGLTLPSTTNFPLSSQPPFFSYSTPSIYTTNLSSTTPLSWSYGGNFGLSYGSNANNSGTSAPTNLSQSNISSSQAQQYSAQHIFNALNSSFGQGYEISPNLGYGFGSSFINSSPSNSFISGNTPTIGSPSFSQSSVPPQVYQFFAQFYKNEEMIPEDKKRKASRQEQPFAKRVRQTRPKVVESKGAIQCKGRNRKKGIQCRNAALMEYIGPRPIYCAEHIELDPKSLYEKCKSPYQKEPGDGKGCKEVVLKEFGICYKHYGDAVAEIVKKNDYPKALKDLHRTNELLTQLEKEAAAAKKKDGDLYQRKNKLIPKFQEMKKLISRAVAQLKPKDELNQDQENTQEAQEAPSQLDLPSSIITPSQDLVLNFSDYNKHITDFPGQNMNHELHVHIPFGEIEQLSC